MKTLTTNVIKGQVQYMFPILQDITLQIFNKRKKEWRSQGFTILIEPTKILKTDMELRLILEEPSSCR